ncbi:hypothetical protein HYR54_07445 [Candidatus Acetothermia bacterium]|nr:hypothetical protein [Candidatus Acetothermia bacterium]
MKLETHQAVTVEKQTEVLIAVGLYKTQSETIKDSLRAMLRQYKGNLMPLPRVRAALAEIPQEVELSEEVVALRKREMSRYLEG